MTWPIFGDHELKRKAINRIMLSGDPVVAAVVGGTMLEEAVERTLKERMRDNAEGAKRLFNLEKPLSNVTAQIDTLYMLWAIDKTTRDAMLGISRIRNFFAHNLNATFESQSADIVKAFGKLKLHDTFEFYPDARFGTPTTKRIENAANNREIFVLNLKLCLNMLMQDRCRHETHSTELISHETLKQQLTGSGAI